MHSQAFDSAQVAPANQAFGTVAQAHTEGLPPDRGCTCCQDPDLRNDTSKLSHRIDLVIVPPNTEIEEVELVGADPADHTSGLWPSDHAGVVEASEELISRFRKNRCALF
jgi:hypothetical protein